MTQNPNQYIVIGDITHIILYDMSKNPICSAIIDTKNLYKVSPYRWSYSDGYVQTKPLGYRMTLQYVILGLDNCEKSSRIIDHKDGNGLNNLESNLRYYSQSENLRNSARSSEARYSGLDSGKGISYNEKRKRWKVQVKLLGKKTTLGFFNNYTAAVEARQEAEVEIEEIGEEEFKEEITKFNYLKPIPIKKEA